MYQQVSWQASDVITSTKLQTMANNTDIIFKNTPQLMQINYRPETTPDGIAPAQQSRGRPLNQTFAVKSVVAGFGTFDFANPANVPFVTFGIFFPVGAFSYPPIVTVTISSGVVTTANLMCGMISNDASAVNFLYTVWYSDLKGRPFHGTINYIAYGY